MNNLKLSSELSLRLDLQSKDEVVLFCAFDIEGNRLFFASSSNLIYKTQLPSLPNETKIPLPLEAEHIDLENGASITSFEYIMEKEALIIGTSDGLLLLHLLDGNGNEVVGTVEGGIRSISLSPDGDLVTVVTGFHQLLVMTHDWDLLYEIPLDDIADDVDVREPKSSSKHSISISWRGDGKYFATLSEFPDSFLMHKLLKIWERDSGKLHSATESKPFMGTALDWMPSGAKIAAVYDRKAEEKCPEIVFYEKNGLQRSSFDINQPVDAKVELLKWNCNSDILSAIVSGEQYDAIRVWFFSNNHWYLKQEIRYSKQDRVRLLWNPVKPFQLICWTCKGEVTIYNFVWITAVMENSVALVIDNSKILISPLSLSLLPPPMYLFELHFSSPVREMTFSPKNSTNRLAVHLSDGSLCVTELPAFDAWEELEGQAFKIEASYLENELGSLLHLIWLDSNELLGISYFEKDGHYGYYLQEIGLVCSEDHVPGLLTCSGWHAKKLNHVPLEGIVIGIAPNSAKDNSAFVQFDEGSVFEYTSNIGGISEHVFSFLCSCPWMSVIPFYGSAKPLLFGLDEVGRLYFNGKVLCNNCSSFSFYSNGNEVTHLILSTKQDLLFIVDIKDIIDDKLEEKYENFILGVKRREDDQAKTFIKIWERGAKVVGVLHGDGSAVILLTPRGNFELIYPRKLVLSSIVNALNQGRFNDALLMVRRHRIDFNIIVDYFGWQNFLQLATQFVSQVDNLNYITEFVCSVKNENVVETLYKNSLSRFSSKEIKNVEAKNSNRKLNSVILAIRKALENQVLESPVRELCILTTLARNDPPAIEEALGRIKKIRDMELLGSDYPKRPSYPSAEEALKHLLWLSDPEAVYQAALGLYDLNLAAIVALNSQQDPKEFLPFLQELQHMPTLLMQYNIDLKLQKYEDALKHIVLAGDAYSEDVMNLMKKHPQLYPLGLELIADPSQKMQVLESWGDYLSDQKSFENAATAFLCCSNMKKALKAYRNSGNWGAVLTVAGLLNMGKEEVIQLANELCEELQALNKPREAARIALEYCGDFNNGISLLISARDWEESLRLAFMHQRDDWISEVKNASSECTNLLVGEYDDGVEKVGKYVARYLAVRQRRLLLKAKIEAEEGSLNDFDDDAVSEASSNFSGMSAYTMRTKAGSAASVSSTTTSKARGKGRQRNRGKIRAGSPDEELALVEHLKGMSLTAGAESELKSLLNTLVMLGNIETARKLHRAAENFRLSQMAAVKLAGDTVSNTTIDEKAHTLDNYLQKVRSENPLKGDLFCWSKVLVFS